MKKFLVFLQVFILCLLLTACKKSSGVTPTARGIAFCGAVSYYNECYEGNVTVDADGNMTVEITSPPSLCGLVMSFSGDEATAEYCGLEYKYDISAMPEGSAYTLLYEILSAAASSQVLESSNEYITEGSLHGNAFRLTLGATGLPISAEVPSCGFSAEFKNISLISSR